MKLIGFLMLITFFGLASCTQNEANLVAQKTTKEQETVFITAAEYQLNEELSTIEWKGSGPDHFHIGAFKAKGNLRTDGIGNISNGEFTIPIASITNFDLTQTEVREKLLNHLKSADFFDIAVHPNATFRITEVEPYIVVNNMAKVTLLGDFTMIGQTHSLRIPAVLKFDQGTITATGNFSINRLKWGMRNYSDPKSDLYILPEVELSLNLTFDALGI